MPELLRPRPPQPGALERAGERLPGPPRRAARERGRLGRLADPRVRPPGPGRGRGPRHPLGDESFDVVFCDHGAFSFADPMLLVPEAARLLRPGGLLAFSMISPLLDLCWDARADATGTELVNDYFGLRSIDDGETTSFQLPYGEWIRLFAANGLVVEDLVELRPPAGATTTYETVSYEWARRWPAENIWKARRSG